MIDLLTKAPLYYLFRAVGRPKPLPMNVTFSLSFRCNSRCKTCGVHRKRTQELSSEEWKRVFTGLGRAPFWVTISGGEPFLREDLPAIIRSLYDCCRPAFINIPTNGSLCDRIPAAVTQIVDHCRPSQVVVNVSFDDIGERHDRIRGLPGSFEKATKTFRGLKEIHRSNLTLGIHTVISRFNVARIPKIYDRLMELRPDSYVSEIAEERVELGNVGWPIAPSAAEYAGATSFLEARLRNGAFSKVGRMTRALRIEYYDIVRRVLLKRRQIIPCFAAFASAHVAPNGDVWPCCVKAESMGNLRDADYDFKKIWLSSKADQLRRSIKAGDCYCPLANASYTNMLHDMKTLLRAAFNLVTLK